MSEKELESKVALRLMRLKINAIKNVRLGKWEADFVLKTASGGSIVIEVKDRKIGLPDVLSVVSNASNMSTSVDSFSGTIITTAKPSEVVLQLAARNNIAILPISKIEDLDNKLTIINLIAEIEVLIRKKYGLDKGEKLTFVNIVDKLRENKVIDDSLCKELKFIWEIRNKMVHGRDVLDSELNEAIKKAEDIITKLKQQD